LHIIVLSRKGVYKCALALSTDGKGGGWFNSIVQYKSPPPPTRKERGLLANQTTEVPGSSLDPEIGVGPDDGQQLGNVGGCVTKAPGVALLPNLPCY